MAQLIRVGKKGSHAERDLHLVQTPVMTGRL